jgi:TRAP-type mannitol/chloroaromatic compound transport system permease large subunit
MIRLHGQEKWDRAVAQQAAIDGGGGGAAAAPRTAEQLAEARAAALAGAAPIGSGVGILCLLLGLALVVARGVSPSSDPRPLVIGAGGLIAAILADVLFIGPLTSSGLTFVILALPFAVTLWAMRDAAARLARNDLIRVTFPPLILIVAVLGSILGGVTNPTPAAALGAAGAIMLAAFRRLQDDRKSGRFVLITAYATVIMLLVGVNFDLRVTVGSPSFEQWVAFLVAQVAYHVAVGGVLYACWVLFSTGVLTPVVRETAKITSMVFAILIGSQVLNLVLISFGGEHYIQSFLRAFDNEATAFLIVMLVLFILGFVLDFLEIIYIVVPIVGPVIYGGSFDPAWVTIMITINLQTSFLTPPFGFALFYLRGVAPREVTTAHIYQGVIPFVILQVVMLMLLWLFPEIVTIVPALLG